MISVSEIKSVAIRKSIHFLVALMPLLAAVNYPLTVAVLCAGTIFYSFIESFRFCGKIPACDYPSRNIIAKITIFASHRRDKNRFVLGPLTLGAGALTALTFFPLPPASIAIYALAFGDGLAGLAGRVLGTIRPPFLFGKSLEGSIVCFAAIFFSAQLVSHNWTTSLVCGITGTIIEALPLEDFDNIFLPFGVGAAAALLS